MATESSTTTENQDTHHVIQNTRSPTPAPLLNNGDQSTSPSDPHQPLPNYPSYMELYGLCAHFYSKQIPKDLDILNCGYFVVNFRKLVLSASIKQPHVNKGTYINPPELMLLCYYILRNNSKLYFEPTSTRGIIPSFKLFISSIFTKQNKLNYNDSCRSLLTLVNLVSNKLPNLQINKFKTSDAFKARTINNNVFASFDLKQIAKGLDDGDLSFANDSIISLSQHEIAGAEGDGPLSIETENGNSWSLSDSLHDLEVLNKKNDNEDEDLIIINNKNKNKNISDKHESEDNDHDSSIVIDNNKNKNKNKNIQKDVSGSELKETITDSELMIILHRNDIRYVTCGILLIIIGK